MRLPRGRRRKRSPAPRIRPASQLVSLPVPITEDTPSTPRPDSGAAAADPPAPTGRFKEPHAHYHPRTCRQSRAQTSRSPGAGSAGQWPHGPRLRGLGSRSASVRWSVRSTREDGEEPLPRSSRPVGLRSNGPSTITETRGDWRAKLEEVAKKRGRASLAWLIFQNSIQSLFKLSLDDGNRSRGVQRE